MKIWGGSLWQENCCIFTSHVILRNPKNISDQLIFCNCKIRTHSLESLIYWIRWIHTRKIFAICFSNFEWTRKTRIRAYSLVPDTRSFHQLKFDYVQNNKRSIGERKENIFTWNSWKIRKSKQKKICFFYYVNKSEKNYFFSARLLLLLFCVQKLLHFLPFISFSFCFFLFLLRFVVYKMLFKVAHSR